MRQHIRKTMPRIPTLTLHPLKHLDIPRAHTLKVLGPNIVLGTDMHEPHKHGRNLRHHVVVMRNAIVIPLLRDVPAQRLVRDPRRAICVQIDAVLEVSELGSGEGGNGATEGVSRDDYFVGRVRGCEGLDCGEDLGAGVYPGLPEAGVGGAVFAEIGVDGVEFEVGDPVVEGGGASEDDDDEFVGGVEGDETGDV
jgi:hypothetical protein